MLGQYALPLALIKLKVAQDRSESTTVSISSEYGGPTFLNKVEAGKNEQRIQLLVDKQMQVVGFETYSAGDVFVEIGGLFAIFGSILYALCAMIGLFVGASFLNATADLI